MLSELFQAQKFLSQKFGHVDNIQPGTYAIPTETSKGKAFMKVIIWENLSVSDFSLYWDEQLTQKWE